MRTFAPGKLVLSGAYVVLEGAPATAVAVSRGAYADSGRSALTPTPEVCAALGAEHAAPHADASSMFVGARKLGLGASAAILVASLAARAADAGADLTSLQVREELFLAARRAHASAQEGGSGIDVATSVYGGAVRYVVGEPVRRAALPAGLELAVLACGTSARTSELRAEVDRFAQDDAVAHRRCMDDLQMTARQAADALDTGNGPAFVEALRRTARGLARLGTAAQIEIVPPRFEELEALAAREEASFCVSGAGGGDVAVYLGPAPPSPRFIEHAHALGLFPLALSLDSKGVRVAPAVPTLAEIPHRAS